MASKKVYPIAPEVGESGEWTLGIPFLPGVTPDGEQLIVCWVGNTVYAHRFSANGEYLGRTKPTWRRIRSSSAMPSQSGANCSTMRDTAGCSRATMGAVSGR